MDDGLRVDEDVDTLGGTSKSQRASITSSPLFIRVAESIVIFGPMCQVGCCSASAGVTVPALSRQAANGPPDAVRISRCTPRRAVQAL